MVDLNFHFNAPSGCTPRNICVGYFMIFVRVLGRRRMVVGSVYNNFGFFSALTKSASTDSLQSLLPEEVVGRLLGGVSFGYGSFQVNEI